jgi:hypothetical protein
MMRRYFDPDDLDDPEADRICRDGESVRTSAILLDSVHRDVEAAIQARQSTRTFADADLELHRPGSRPHLDTAAARASETAWEARGAYLANAWRSPAPLPPDSTARQHLDHRPAGTAADAQAAWEARGAQLREAWRLP